MGNMFLKGCDLLASAVPV